MSTASPTIDWSARDATDRWLLSHAGDFWILCAGGGIVIIALALALHWFGDRELAATDVLLGELHLGATYDAVVRGRLWRRMPIEVLAIPVAILVATYFLMYGHAILVTTAALYLAAWHRGRQNLGIARYYQVRTGGAVSHWHGKLFRAAIYLPMLAGVAYFTSTASLIEDEEFIGLGLGDEVLWLLGALAVASLAAYLAFAARYRNRVHPGEWWIVTANALAFGSAYVLGAWTMSFILVLALHHEVQYLYFTYAQARRSAAPQLLERRGELRLLGSFMVWPAIGLASWAVCTYSELPWLAPFLVGGLLAHYWLDSCIWTARARRLARA